MIAASVHRSEQCLLGASWCRVVLCDKTVWAGGCIPRPGRAALRDDYLESVSVFTGASDDVVSKLRELRYTVKAGSYNEVGESYVSTIDTL